MPLTPESLTQRYERTLQADPEALREWHTPEVGEALCAHFQPGHDALLQQWIHTHPHRFNALSDATLHAWVEQHWLRPLPSDLSLTDEAIDEWIQQVDERTQQLRVFLTAFEPYDCFTLLKRMWDSAHHLPEERAPDGSYTRCPGNPRRRHFTYTLLNQCANSPALMRDPNNVRALHLFLQPMLSAVIFEAHHLYRLLFATGWMEPVFLREDVTYASNVWVTRLLFACLRYTSLLQDLATSPIIMELLQKAADLVLKSSLAELNRPLSVTFTSMKGKGRKQTTAVGGTVIKQTSWIVAEYALCRLFKDPHTTNSKLSVPLIRAMCATSPTVHHALSHITRFLLLASIWKTAAQYGQIAAEFFGPTLVCADQTEIATENEKQAEIIATIISRNPEEMYTSTPLLSHQPAYFNTARQSSLFPQTDFISEPNAIEMAPTSTQTALNHLEIQALWYLIESLVHKAPIDLRTIQALQSEDRTLRHPLNQVSPIKQLCQNPLFHLWQMVAADDAAPTTSDTMHP